MYSIPYIENDVRRSRRNKDDYLISYNEKNNGMCFRVFCVDSFALCRHAVICEHMYALFVVRFCFVGGFGFNTTMFGVALDDLQWRSQDDGHAFGNWWLYFSVS